MSKIKAITIIEHYYDDSDCVGVYDYDKLPKNVKDNVDKALKDEHKSAYLDPAEEGLQYLFDKSDDHLRDDTECVFMTIVHFWERY